jgi:hypothetical protein
MRPDLPDGAAIVAHDAGAANQIFAWLGPGPRPEPAGCRVFVAGPAAQLWAQRFAAHPPAASLRDALDGARWLLSGTGWGSTLEHEARHEAAGRGLRSVAVVDHWVNYRPRFERGGQWVWPDEIWVVDEWARAEARRSLPECPSRLVPGAYLDEQRSAIAPLAVAGDDVLVVLEPARSDWGRGEPGEFQALDWLLEHGRHLRRGGRGALRLRPHPSDAPGKYDAWLAARRRRHADWPMCVDTSADLAAAIGACHTVVGLHSYALVVALAAGRRVVCALPPWAPPCALPHPGIERLVTAPNLAPHP